MRRFFYNQPNMLKIGENLPITEDIFHHWCKVLRANIGEQAVFFDGNGGEYTVSLSEISKKSAMVTVESYNQINRNLPFNVTIGLVMSRGDRMDYAIQKATETGVHSIQLLTSQHGEVRLKPDQIAKKLEHWQAVAVAACEQCGLNLVPAIVPPKDICDFIQNPIESQKNLYKLVLAVPDRLATVQIFNQKHFDKNADYQLLIGAEGGLSDIELQLAYQHDFLAWQIGERVLRTETAPVVALTALQTLYTLHC